MIHCERRACDSWAFWNCNRINSDNPRLHTSRWSSYCCCDIKCSLHFSSLRLLIYLFFLVVSAVEKCNLHSLNWCSRCEWIHLCELEWEHRWLHIRNSFSLYSKLFFTSRLLHCTVCLEKYSIYHHYVCIYLSSCPPIHEFDFMQLK